MPPIENNPNRAAALPKGQPTPGVGEPQSEVGKLVGDARMDILTCPVLRTGVMEGKLHPDKEGNIDGNELGDFFSSLGVDSFLDTALVKGGENTQAGGVLPTLEAKSLNLYKLHTGPLMHNGDTGILRNGYNQERMDNTLSYSSDGKTLTTKDVARMQLDLLKADPGERGHTFGTAELSALLELFGDKNKDGDLAMTNDNVVRVFRDNRLPIGWKPHKVNAFNLGGEIFHFSQAQKDIVKHGGGGNVDISKLDPKTLEAMRKGLCPAYRPDAAPIAVTSRDDFASLHEQAAIKNTEV